LDSQWEFTSSINCFVGDNGAGKTNILDAIHYLSLTKSYFNSNDSTSINFNSEFFTIKGSFKKQDNFSDIVCNVKEGHPKSVKNNDKKYKRFSEKQQNSEFFVFCEKHSHNFVKKLRYKFVKNSF
jgi:DNA replication and repair protein RecF